jgi:glycosyltransferase involved in cell wall biosynthesis
MIIKDEAKNLPLSLGPLSGLFEEMVVVDTGSTDQSPEMAAAYGAAVVHLAWPGDFSKARNFGLNRLTTDYILWLDADNSITMAGVNCLRDRLTGEPAVLRATEVVVPQGDRLWQKRVFPNSPEAFFIGSIHEQLTHPPHWPVLDTQAEIRHWGYADAASARLKGQRNLELLLTAPETLEGDFYYLYQTGRTLANLRALKEAEFFLTKAAKAWDDQGESAPGDLNPSIWCHALILLSQVKTKLGKTDEALETLFYLCRHSPAYGPGRYYLGRYYYEAGNFSDAAKQLSKALVFGCGDKGWGADEAKNAFSAASMLAKALEKTGENQKAAAAWRTAASLNPEHPEPYVALAESLMAAGDQRQAKEFLELAISLAPAHRRARNLYGSLGGS